MHHVLRAGVIGALVLGGAAATASAQVVSYTFEGGTDEGWGRKFSNDASFAFPIVNIGGSNRMGVDRSGGFQEAEYASTGATDPLVLAFNAAAVDETLYQISYDWYVDTSAGGYGTFLQVGTYVNTGSGYYAQNFPGTGKEVELNGTQLASGQAFSGNVT